MSTSKKVSVPYSFSFVLGSLLCRLRVRSARPESNQNSPRFAVTSPPPLRFGAASPPALLFDEFGWPHGIKPARLRESAKGLLPAGRADPLRSRSGSGAHGVTRPTGLPVSRPRGTWSPHNGVPTLKRRAILGSPLGTKSGTAGAICSARWARAGRLRTAIFEKTTGWDANQNR
jgi:hypothetical protein